MAGSPNCPGQENLGQHPNVIGHYALCMTQDQAHASLENNKINSYFPAMLVIKNCKAVAVPYFPSNKSYKATFTAVGKGSQQNSDMGVLILQKKMPQSGVRSVCKQLGHLYF